MYRVMIVDDDKWALTDISLMFPFARYGFELVATCTSAEAAEREFARLLPDLLITDIVMGKKSGLDLLRTCKKLREDVVVVIISGHDDFAYARQAVNDGAFYYMLKPIDTDEVEPVLRRIAMHLSAESADGIAGVEPFDRILHYIQENLSPSLSLGELAREFGYNRSYLSELFAGRLGVTFTDYKKKLYVRRACAKLHQPRKSIADVAAELDFGDMRYFSRVFKEIMGMSPSAYKRLVCDENAKDECELSDETSSEDEKIPGI